MNMFNFSIDLKVKFEFGMPGAGYFPTNFFENRLL